MTKKKEPNTLNPPPLLDSGEVYSLNTETRKRVSFFEDGSEETSESEVNSQEQPIVLNQAPETPTEMKTGGIEFAHEFPDDEGTIEQPPTEEMAHHLFAETVSDYQAPANVPNPPPIPDLFTLDDRAPEPLPEPPSAYARLKGRLRYYRGGVLRSAKVLIRRGIVPTLVLMSGVLTLYVITTADGGQPFSVDALKQQWAKVTMTTSNYVDEVRGEVRRLDRGEEGGPKVRQEKVPSMVEEAPLEALPSSVPTRQSLRRTALSPKKPDNRVRTVSEGTNMKSLSSASKGNVGVIRVDGNRRALIYVGDEPVGYSPVNVSAPVGQYEVTATLPSRPGVTEKKSVNLSSRGEVVEVNFSFSDQK